MSTGETRETPHQPQISKAKVATDNLEVYFRQFLKTFAISASDERIEKTAAMLAETSYKIVKRAEGYEVQA